MTALVICRGLPASGKTTRARQWVAANPEGRARVNRDDLRAMLHDGVYLGHGTERQVVKARNQAVETLLRARISVVSDDTNLPQKVARELADLGRQCGATIEVWDMTDVPYAECVRRDLARERTVGEKVIRGMRDRYLARGPLEPLSGPQEAREAPYAYVPDGTLPPAWLVDVDGTLARMVGRGPFEWGRVGEDEPVEHVVELVRSLAGSGHRIVVMSGRDASCRDETLAWLRGQGIPFYELHMRPAGDTRNDAVVKLELFRAEVAPRWNVRGVLDDRDRVVAMWRSIGLLCAQVAPGDF